MTRIQLLFIFILFVFVADAQKTLLGHVRIAGSNNPVASANVYLSTTSVGTTTNEKRRIHDTTFPWREV